MANNWKNAWVLVSTAGRHMKKITQSPLRVRLTHICKIADTQGTLTTADLWLYKFKVVKKEKERLRSHMFCTLANFGTFVAHNLPQNSIDINRNKYTYNKHEQSDEHPCYDHLLRLRKNLGMPPLLLVLLISSMVACHENVILAHQSCAI